MNSLTEFAERYKKLRLELENDNSEVEQDVNDLENDIQYALDFATENNEEISHAKEEFIKGLQGLLKKVQKLKKKFDFYDEEAELDRMFPNRDDDDFDEDSMSYNSVVGDE